MTINVDGVKLVPEDMLAPEVAANEAVELAVQQASGWGVNRHDSIILRLAYELEKVLDENARAADLAAQLDEAKRTIKGLQLANGRLKKQGTAK